MLYGRTDDCAVLAGLLGATGGGTSAAVVVRGEAGVGKTALMDWLQQEAVQRGGEVLRCAGVASESHLPFAGLHQLLRPAIHVMPALARLHQEALGGALGLSRRRGVDPFLVGVAALSLLGELAEGRAVTCIVDDAQWLDAPTADVFRFVARRLDAEGVLLVFAVRDPDDGSFEAPGLPEHWLRGLDDGASSALLVDRAPMISAEVKDRLIEHHAGNPLALIELAPLLTGDQLSGREPLPDPLPMGGGVERLYAARAAGLSPGAQQLLLLAATADTAGLDLVLGASVALGIDSGSLQEAEASGLIAAGHGVVVFKHPLVRSAIHQQSTFLQRRRGHLAMAALLDDEANADRRAWHLVRAATGPDDQLAVLLEASAERAMARGGPAAAVDRWQWAAEFSRSEVDRARRFLYAAEVAVQAGQPERARQLLALHGALLPDAPSRARALLGAIEMRHGSPEAAYHLLVEAANDLAAVDPSAALDSLVLAGEAATFLGDPRLTQQVSVLATKLREAGAMVDGSVVDLLVGLSKLFDGNWSEGSRILAGVVDESVVSSEYDDVLRSGRAAMYLGRLGDARTLYARAVSQARDSSSAGRLAPMLDRLAYIELLLGRLPDAEVHGLEGLRLADDLSLDAGVGHVSMAMLYAYRGQQTECRAQVRLAMELAESRQLKMVGAGAQAALGLLELGAGRLDEALSALESVGSSTDGHPGILRWATPDLVEAAARSGRPEVCAPAVERLQAWADASGLPIPVAALARCRGLLASGNEAVRYFEDALRADDQDTRPLERARIQLLLGETLRRSRQRAQSRTYLRSAMATFERLGASPWADRAGTELRASGEAVTPRDPSGRATLTPQELQIAQYAADGDSNAEIAARLFLSRRTVEYHLAKVYTKTGVTSRRHLATATALT
ncbi:LuxR C-terminal-related transcriptional regulator [Kribbella sp. NBC_00709]|uniref:ATP-binding protein n=1 Tax=Kribbella sp. NBC_00709 TaxID=2975972 RepID=UPI002E28743D|nr:LuxR C-terminal-related transcriptional regulator [Kribbella sp. NBC_00709]